MVPPIFGCPPFLHAEWHFLPLTLYVHELFWIDVVVVLGYYSQIDRDSHGPFSELSRPSVSAFCIILQIPSVFFLGGTLPFPIAS